MDLSGHRRFQPPSALAEAVNPVPDTCNRVGKALLATAYTALVSARAETVDVHLKGGKVIEDVIGVRMFAALAEVSIRRGEWTHAFAAADVVMVRQIPRGGRRS
jgi:hypothetical protein